MAFWPRTLRPSALSRVTGALLDVLYPPRCLGCGEEGTYLCPQCAPRLPRLHPPFCSSCGEPLPAEGRCARCLAAPLPIDGIRSVFRMEGAVREAVHGLKYRGLRALAVPLGQELAACMEALPFAPEALVPVPLHPRRLRQRGYNQANLLAQAVVRATSLPLLQGALERRRDTAPQARTAGRRERWANVAEAFVSRGGVEGRSLLLIDDVCTTGATLAACAHALRAAGAGRVWGLTVAREV